VTCLRYVDETAALVGGPAHVTLADASECAPGLPDGVQFGYGLSIAGGQSATVALDEVADLWERFSIAATIEGDTVRSTSVPWEPTDEPVGSVAFSRFAEHETHPES